MTREEFIAKIENPDDVERVMARVDEGIKLMNYTDATKIAEWYDRCANLYDQSMLPSTIEGVPDMVTGVEHGVTVNEFSFLHFNTLLSELFDRYRSLMFSVEREDRITSDVGEEKLSLMRIVDEYVGRSGNVYNDPSFVHSLHKVVAKYLGEYVSALDTRADDLADAIAILKAREYMAQTRDQAHKANHYIQSVSFTPSDDVTIKIKGERALELLGEVFIPYYCDRFLNKFDMSTLEAEQKKCAKLKNKVYHKTIYEIYKLFIKYYNNKFSYNLDSDRYQLDERDGKSPGLVSEISVWIHDLMAEIHGDFDKYKGRKDKVDFIKTRMESVTSDLEIDLPREWSLFLYW